jgi:hypothetical protein
MNSQFRIVDLFGVPTHGGTVAARCAWRIEEDVIGRVEGAPVHVASHVRDGEGRTLNHDGPRSAPVDLNPNCREIVVPLAIPEEAGTFLVDFDAVVEGRFWLSEFSVPFSSLRIERSPDGSIVGHDTRTGQFFRVEAPSAAGRNRFRSPHSLYGAGESERCVEIPWVLSRYRGERRVLDVGTSFAEPRYLEALRNLRIPFLFSLDLVPADALRGGGIVGDARQPPIRPGSIEMIFAISVVEHIGRDNSIYLKGQRGPSDTNGDLEAIRALASLLAPGGRLLVTVPFGQIEDHGWFIQYDFARLQRLLAASGLDLAELEFFGYSGAWRGPLPGASLRRCRYGNAAIAASGLACFTLVRDDGLLSNVRRRTLAWRKWLTG